MGYLKKERKKRAASLLILMLFLFCVICMIFERGRPNASVMKKDITEEVAGKLSKSYSPSLQFVKYAGEASGFMAGIGNMMAGQIPIFAYIDEKSREFTVSEDSHMREMIVLQEGKDEYFENTLFAAMEMENKLQSITEEESESAVPSEDAPQQVLFQKRLQKQNTYSLEELKDYEFLMEHLYVVDAETSVNASLIDGERFLKEDLSIDKNTEGYQILIYHTHSQEGYSDSVAGNSSDTVVGMGEYLSSILTTEYGYSVLHHTGEYDVANRDYAYSNAAPAIEAILKEHPEIEAVIDLHRDAVNENRRLVCDIDGRSTAQIMFFNGLSHTNSLGDIDYLKNPYLQQNLALSFQMQVATNEFYPGLTRRVYLRGYRYNMHFRPKTMLIELGAQTNTASEARNACEPLAQMLDYVFQNKVYEE